MEKEEPMKYILIALLGFVLVGCSSPVKQIEVSTKPIERPNLVVPKIDPVKQKDVEWIVITEENAQEVWERIKKDKKDPVLIGLTDDGYEVLANNMSDIMKLLQQQKAIIAAYQNYYEESEKALEDANSEIKGAKDEVDKQNNTPQESVLDKINPFK